MLDKKLILELYKKRNRISEIASIMGVSRQRIHQIISRYITYSYKSKKRIKLSVNGCAICHERAQLMHHIDHDSHNNNLKNLLPLCIKCHKKIHRGTKYNTIKHFNIYICNICGKTFKRPYGSASRGLFCSNKCKGKSMELRKGRWSLNHSECIICNTTSIPHAGKGMCKNCYMRMWHRKKRKEDLEFM